MMKIKKMPDNQSGFFIINFEKFYIDEYSYSFDSVLKMVNNVVLGRNTYFFELKREIVDADYFLMVKIKKMNVFLDKLRKLSEDKEYYELCYNLAQLNLFISSAICLYKEFENF